MQQHFPIDRLPCEDGEEWRHIVGWGDAYAVSSLGRVARLAPSTRTVPGQMLTGSLNKVHGYRMVQLSSPRATEAIHRLVWRAFRGAVPAGHRVAHANDDPTDDRLSNLLLATHHETMARNFETGRLTPWQGHASNPRARITQEMIDRVLATRGTHTAPQIAAELGIHQETAHKIRQGRYRRQ